MDPRGLPREMFGGTPGRFPRISQRFFEKFPVKAWEISRDAPGNPQEKTGNPGELAKPPGSFCRNLPRVFPSVEQGFSRLTKPAPSKIAEFPTGSQSTVPRSWHGFPGHEPRDSGVYPQNSRQISRGIPGRRSGNFRRILDKSPGKD